jgi:hypothetical protein
MSCLPYSANVQGHAGVRALHGAVYLANYCFNIGFWKSGRLFNLSFSLFLDFIPLSATRHHPHEASVQREMNAAVGRARLSKPSLPSPKGTSVNSQGA